MSAVRVKMEEIKAYEQFGKLIYREENEAEQIACKNDDILTDVQLKDVVVTYGRRCLCYL